MLRLWLLALPLALNVAAIKVPIVPEDTSSTEVITISQKKYTKEAPQNPIFQDAQTTTDSYQVQPDDQTDPPTYQDANNDGVTIPIRYLLPPRLDAEVHTYPTEPQTDAGDWTPMVQGLPRVTSGPPYAHKFAIPEEPIEPFKDSYGATISLTNEHDLPQETIRQWFNPKLLENSESQETSKEESGQDQNSDSSTGPNNTQIVIPIIIPSRHLQPPLPDSIPSVNFDTSAPPSELKPPLFKPNIVFRKNLKKLKPILPTISLEMKPPTLEQTKKYRNPTILYPKKYSKLNGFKPIPIPMRDYHEGDIEEVPKAKPVKFYKPLSLDEDYVDPKEDEKKALKFQQAEEKRKFQEEEEAKKQQAYIDSKVAEAFASPDSASSEQEASETGFYGGGRDSYAAPLPAQAPVAEEAPAPAERTEFRMHGLQGPHSYKFGYDTGKGKNRQFRYEERSNDGHVKGHYGYVDRHGKTQVVNYDAHPEHGFHAEGPFGKV